MWLLIYSFLIGGGAARLAETRPLTEERVVRPPPCVRDPTPARAKGTDCFAFRCRFACRDSAYRVGAKASETFGGYIGIPMWRGKNKRSSRAGAKCCKARRKSLSPRVPQPDVATVSDAHVRTSHFLSAFPTPPPIAVASPGTAMAQCGARPQRSEERYSSSKAWLVDA